MPPPRSRLAQQHATHNTSNRTPQVPEWDIMPRGATGPRSVIMSFFNNPEDIWAASFINDSWYVASVHPLVWRNKLIAGTAAFSKTMKLPQRHAKKLIDTITVLDFPQPTMYQQVLRSLLSPPARLTLHASSHDATAFDVGSVMSTYVDQEVLSTHGSPILSVLIILWCCVDSSTNEEEAAKANQVILHTVCRMVGERAMTPQVLQWIVSIFEHCGRISDFFAGFTTPALLILEALFGNGSFDSVKGDQQGFKRYFATRVVAALALHWELESASLTTQGEASTEQPAPSEDEEAELKMMSDWVFRATLGLPPMREVEGREKGVVVGDEDTIVRRELANLLITVVQRYDDLLPIVEAQCAHVPALHEIIVRESTKMRHSTHPPQTASVQPPTPTPPPGVGRLQQKLSNSTTKPVPMTTPARALPTKKKDIAGGAAKHSPKQYPSGHSPQELLRQSGTFDGDHPDDDIWNDA